MEGDTLTTWGYGAVNTQGAGYEVFADPLTTWGYIFIFHPIVAVVDIIISVNSKITDLLAIDSRIYKQGT